MFFSCDWFGINYRLPHLVLICCQNPDSTAEMFTNCVSQQMEVSTLSWCQLLEYACLSFVRRLGNS